MAFPHSLRIQPFLLAPYTSGVSGRETSAIQRQKFNTNDLIRPESGRWVLIGWCGNYISFIVFEWQTKNKGHKDQNVKVNEKSTKIQSLFLEYIIFLFWKGNWGLLLQTNNLIKL